MKLRLACGIAAALAGCGKSSTSAGGGSAAGSGDGSGSADAGPFAAWARPEAAAQWKGAWSARMSPLMTGRKRNTVSGAGDAVAIVVADDKATVWGGGPDIAMTFALESPCEAKFVEPLAEGSMKGGTAQHYEVFVLDGGKLAFGQGAAGYRKGKSAIVCDESNGTTLVDDKGGCQTWQAHFGKLESKPDTCAWSQKDGKDVLAIGTGDWARKLTATGDVLESDSFVDSLKLVAKAKDLADAKAQVQVILDKNDPSVQAKNAGGVVGKTDTIVSLTATIGSDKSAVGKPLTMTGVVKQTGTMTANGVPSNQTLLVDVGAKDTSIDMFCTGSAAVPAGVKLDDTVTATGTLAISFDKPELRDCTVAKP